MDNLIDLLEICTKHPAAANRTFLVSDCEDVSTTKLLRRLSVAMKKSIYLIPISVGWLQLIAKIFGQKKVAKKLFCSLEIDVSETQHILGWKPIISMEKALERLYDKIS